MPSLHKTFPIGKVTVEVFTKDGTSSVEDWAPEDAEEARDFARETADCTDVAKVEYRFGSVFKTFTAEQNATA